MSFETSIRLPWGGEELIYIGDPELGQGNWNYGIIQEIPGPHMICDLNGKGLKWSEVENGMEVKIKAKNVNPEYPTYEFLYSSEGIRGTHYFYSINAKHAIVLLIRYTFSKY